MTKFYTLIIILGLVSKVLAQVNIEFDKPIDAWRIVSILNTKDNHLLLYGDKNRRSVELIKMNYYGDTIWTETFDKLNRVVTANAISETNDSGYVFAFRTDNSDEIIINRVDKYGKLIWSRNFTDFRNVYDILYTTDNHVIATVDQPETQLLSLDSEGNILWINSFKEYNFYDGPENMLYQVNNNSFYVLTGENKILEVDSLGKVQNNTMLETSGKPRSWVMKDSSFYLILTDFDSYSIVKLNMNLEEQWSKNYALIGKSPSTQASISYCPNNIYTFIENFDSLRLDIVSLAGDSLYSSNATPFWAETGGILHSTNNSTNNVFVVKDVNHLEVTMAKFSCENIVTNVPSEFDELFTFFPNPATDMIQFSSIEEWAITNSNGKELLSGTSLIVDLSSLSEGIYFVRQNTRVVKLIKN